MIANENGINQSSTISYLFGIGAHDKVYTGGVNSAVYEVYRLSPRRLLVCFTIWTYEEQLEIVRLASVIQDTSDGGAATSQLQKQIGADLDRANNKDVRGFNELVLAEIRRRKALTKANLDTQIQQGGQPPPAQPAVQPADKPPVKDQPSPPASKDAPGSRMTGPRAAQ